MSDLSDFQTWDEARLAAEAEAWIAAGEGQTIEFKQALPAQIRDLAKEVAAFATSNAGVLLLGVSDQGVATGLPDLATPNGRELIRQRIEGMLSAHVKPAVTPRVGFLTPLGVVALLVPQGPAPVYYANGVPYVRQVTSSRPASPDEVIQLVLAWDAKRRGEVPVVDEALTSLFSQILDLTLEIMTDAADGASPARMAGARDDLQRRFGRLAEVARQASTHAPEAQVGLEDDLLKLGHALDRVAALRLEKGLGWGELEAAIVVAGEEAAELKARWLGDQVNDATAKQVDAALAPMAKGLRNLAARAPDLRQQGALQTLKLEAGRYGRQFLKAAQFGVGVGGDLGRAELAAIGIALREVEIIQVFVDGGMSATAIVSGIERASGALDTLLASLA